MNGTKHLLRRPGRRGPAMLALLTACLSWGCGERAALPGGARQGAAPVVAHAAPDWESLPRWSLAEAPEWEIGGRSAPPEYAFAAISGAAILSDGSVAISSYATGDVRIFDREGVHLGTTGGSGRPPSFIAPRVVGTFGGDSLLVTDIEQRRAGVLDASGEFVRVLNPAREARLAFPVIVGVFESGRMLVYEGPDYSLTTPRGVRRVPARIHYANPEGQIEALLGEFMGAEVSILPDSGGVTVSTVPFTSDLFLFVRGDRVAAGHSDQFVIDLYDDAGTHELTIRQTREPVPIPAEAIERQISNALERERSAAARELAEQRFAQMTHRSTYPLFSAFRMDRLGNLWVEEYRIPEQETSRWQIFDSEGALVAYLELPREMAILDVDADLLLATWRDDEGEGRVGLYRIVKGG